MHFLDLDTIRRTVGDSPVADLEDLVLSMVRWQVALQPTVGPTSSWMWGAPHAPAGFAWPTYRDRPLTFLAQIDLSAIPLVPGLANLAGEGTWLCFGGASLVEGPWGLEPDDEGLGQVIAVPPGTSIGPVEPPSFPAEQHLASQPPEYLEAEGVYPALPLGHGTPLSEALGERVVDFPEAALSEAAPSDPPATLFGWSSPWQECPETVVQGLLGDHRSWALLLQLEDDVGSSYLTVPVDRLAGPGDAPIWYIWDCS